MNLPIITCLVVCVCGRVGVGVRVRACVRVFMSASAVVYVSSNVSYAQRIRLAHKLFTIIHKWTGSCCALFVLCGWNVTKTNSSARFFSVIAEYITLYPYISNMSSNISNI